MSLRPTICLFGDSITQQAFDVQRHGWAAQLADLLIRKVDVLNRGFSGFTTNRIEPAMSRIFPPAQQHLLTTVFFGANDASSGGQHVPLDVYANSLDRIIQHIQKVSQHVIIIGPGAVNGFQDRSNESVEKYSAVCAKIAKSRNTLHLNLYEEMKAQPDWKDYLHDGLHFSTKGNDFVFSKLKTMLPFEPETLPWDIPQWRDIDPDHAAESYTPNALKNLDYHCLPPPETE
eukprot:m.160964 g.160964  ORF g.160964 m.160964 type:complete len:231 (-) comp24836_c0_seq9:193-885(-)